MILTDARLTSSSLGLIGSARVQRRSPWSTPTLNQTFSATKQNQGERSTTRLRSFLRRLGGHRVIPED